MLSELWQVLCAYYDTTPFWQRPVEELLHGRSHWSTQSLFPICFCSLLPAFVAIAWNHRRLLSIWPLLGLLGLALLAFTCSVAFSWNSSTRGLLITQGDVLVLTLALSFCGMLIEACYARQDRVRLLIVLLCVIPSYPLFHRMAVWPHLIPPDHGSACPEPSADPAAIGGDRR